MGTTLCLSLRRIGPEAAQTWKTYLRVPNLFKAQRNRFPSRLPSPLLSRSPHSQLPNSTTTGQSPPRRHSHSRERRARASATTQRTAWCAPTFRRAERSLALGRSVYLSSSPLPPLRGSALRRKSGRGRGRTGSRDANDRRDGAAMGESQVESIVVVFFFFVGQC